MKAIILEIRDGYAAALREDGAVVKLQRKCQVGDTVEVGAEVIPFPAARGRKQWMRSAVAAVLALTVAGGSYGYTTATACSYVSLDVEESSVEFSINRLGRVIAVKAVNEEGTALADTLSEDVRNKTVDDAMNTAMQRLRTEGYLDTDSVVIAGITSDSEKRGAEISRTVERSVARQGGEDVQFVMLEASRDERGRARERGMSAGRHLYEQRGYGSQSLSAEEETSGAETGVSWGIGLHAVNPETVSTETEAASSTQSSSSTQSTSSNTAAASQTTTQSKPQTATVQTATVQAQATVTPTVPTTRDPAATAGSTTGTTTNTTADTPRTPTDAPKTTGTQTSSGASAGTDRPAGGSQSDRNQPTGQTGTSDRNQPTGQTGTSDRNQPGGQTGTSDRNQPTGQTGTPNGNQPGGQTGTPNGNQPGGQTGTPNGNQPGGQTGTPNGNQPTGQTGTPNGNQPTGQTGTSDRNQPTGQTGTENGGSQPGENSQPETIVPEDPNEGFLPAPGSGAAQPGPVQADPVAPPDAPPTDSGQRPGNPSQEGNSRPETEEDPNEGFLPAPGTTQPENKPSGDTGNQPSGGDSRLSGDSGNQPSGGDSKPSGDTGNQPSGGENKPSGDTGNQPTGGDSRPSGDTGNQPSGGDSRPSTDTGNQPSGGDSKPSTDTGNQPSGGDSRPSGDTGNQPTGGGPSGDSGPSSAPTEHRSDDGVGQRNPDYQGG